MTFYVRAYLPRNKDFGPYENFEDAESTHRIITKLDFPADILIDVGPGYSTQWLGEVGTRLIPLNLGGAIHLDPVLPIDGMTVSTSIPALGSEDASRLTP